MDFTFSGPAYEPGQMTIGGQPIEEAHSSVFSDTIFPWKRVLSVGEKISPLPFPSAAAGGA
jgi:hypothetical protein